MIIKKFFHEETSVSFVQDEEYCRMFLATTQFEVNQVLEIQGYIFLKDIYLLLGMQPTRESVTAGYIKEKTGFIDFHAEYQEDGSFLLTFEVEEDIRDLLPRDHEWMETD